MNLIRETVITEKFKETIRELDNNKEINTCTFQDLVNIYNERLAEDAGYKMTCIGYKDYVKDGEDKLIIYFTDTEKLFYMIFTGSKTLTGVKRYKESISKEGEDVRPRIVKREKGDMYLM